MQRALMHYFKPYNRELVVKALKKAGREDLIGWGPDCLIPPRAPASRQARVSDGAAKCARPQSGSAGRSMPPRAVAQKDKGKPARDTASKGQDRPVKAATPKDRSKRAKGGAQKPGPNHEPGKVQRRDEPPRRKHPDRGKAKQRSTKR